MKREFLTTGDGSVTIHLPEWDEQYHSKHGAIQEAIHVFMDSGLQYFMETRKAEKVSILEMGFGTGLNALLTQLFSETNVLEIEYTGMEAYPVSLEEIAQLNYPLLLESSPSVFLKMHKAPWEQSVVISNRFTLCKRKQFFLDIEDANAFDIVYFDAFGARVQPDLWTEGLFSKMHRALKNHGVLVTYAAKGSVRRAMQAVGFSVERLSGPPGKREMLRATKSKP